MDPTLKNIAETVAELSAAGHVPQINTVQHPMTGDTALFLTGPNANSIHSLKAVLSEFLTAPERPNGTTRLTTSGSFVAHILDHKGAHSALFAAVDGEHRTSPQIVAVYNHCTALGTPHFGDHRAVYSPELSPAWVTWNKANGKKMSVRDFAAFIEDNMLDLLDIPDLSNPESDGDKALAQFVERSAGTIASPAKMVELSRGLTVHVGQKVKNATNLSTGEIQVQFETEHTNGSGAPLKVPTTFLIGVPVFDGGTPYRMAARLRYSADNGEIVWWFDLWRHAETYRAAVAELCDALAEFTKLPLYRGVR